MKVPNASGAALLVAGWLVACTGRVSLGSPADAPNTDGGVVNGVEAGTAAAKPPAMNGNPDNDATPGSGADAPAGSGCGGMRFDPHNCGACGNDCMGGACQAGACVPLPAGVLATGQLSPTSIVADATNVYWVNEGMPPLASSSQPTSLGPVQILKCAKSGCNNSPTVLATDDSSDHGDGSRLRGLAVDATNVYWASSNALFACAVGGCNNSPTVLNRFTVSQTAGWPGIPPEIAAAAGNVYASDSSAANRFAVDAGGSIPLWALASGLWMAIGIDDASAYIGTTFGEIVSCALGGCGGAPTLLVSKPAQPSPEYILGQLAVDDTNVYWALGQIMPYNPVSNGFVTGCAGTGQVPPGAILKCAKAGCGDNPTTLASGLSCPTGVVTDESNVYFTEPQYYGGGPTPALSDANVGRIGKCNVAGCSNQPTTLAEKLNNPRGIAVDADHAYWTDFGSGGTITMTAPPPSGYLPYSDDGRIVMIAK